MTEQVAEFPVKLQELFQPHRYKVLRGGRGGAKSWSVARALLLIGLQRPIRVLCTRETQKSMRDSVHKLLVDQIARMGMAAHYMIQQVQITGNHEQEADEEVNGEKVKVKRRTEFVFAGLSDMTAASIKSFEAADIVWVEEAHTVSENSWRILIPTIRKPGSEIWVTFNPELDTDPTWKEFIETPRPDTWNCELNWRDNPWFSETLDQERRTDAQRLPKADYEWIWEGKCKPAVTGAIYAEEVAAMFTDNRVGDFPYDAAHPVFAVCDLGWNDSTAIILVQRVVSQLRIIDYIEDDHKTHAYYSAELQKRPYRVSEIFLPHDGAAANMQTGISDERAYQQLGWRATVLPNGDVEAGIRNARMAFSRVFINKRNCDRLVECLKRYKRIIPATTGEPSKPRHDEFSHGADAFRYMVEAAPMMGTMAEGGGLKLPPLTWKWKTG